METEILQDVPLFNGIAKTELAPLFECLHAKRRTFEKGALIYRCGDIVRASGIVLSGSILIAQDDISGSQSVLDRVRPGQMFAENYACIPGEPLLVNVAAAERSEVLFVETGRVLERCEKCCGCHTKLIKNLLEISARKSLGLSRRMFHIKPKTIRARLLSYFSEQAAQWGSMEFDIPFDRQQLADYLNVERSALSAELGKMRKEGLLSFSKQHFYMNI